MKPKLNFDKKIATAVSYVELTLPVLEFSDSSAIDSFRKNVLLAGQGEPVLLSEKDGIIPLMFATEILHAVSPEMAIGSSKGNIFLIFNHQESPVLRSAMVHDFISSKKDVHSTKKTEDVLELDIEKITAGISDNSDEVVAMKAGFQSLRDLIGPCRRFVIIGSGPAALFMYATHLSFGIASEVFYKKDAGSELIKIR